MDHKSDEELIEEFVEGPLNENQANGDQPNERRPNRGRPLPPVETRWKKGVSGNPRGRPKKRETLTDLVRQILRKVCRTDRERRTWGELFVHGLLHSALKGNATASKLIWDRHDGKDARADNGVGERPWDSKRPAEQAELSREALNAIRDIYGLPHLDEEPEKDDSPNPEPGKQKSE